jgi:hypothetical protein
MVRITGRFSMLVSLLIAARVSMLVPGRRCSVHRSRIGGPAARRHRREVGVVRIALRVVQEDCGGRVHQGHSRGITGRQIRVHLAGQAAARQFDVGSRRPPADAQHVVGVVAVQVGELARIHQRRGPIAR